MPYHTAFHFDSVVVIESLRPLDQLTGTDLFETTIAPGALAQDVLFKLHRVGSVVEFLEALESVVELARSGRSPILHLEMHGDESGLELTDGSFVTWGEIAPRLTEVNRLTRVNLLVVAAACNGWHLASVLRPVDRAPAWAVLGPPSSVKAPDLYRGMQRFYSSFLATLDLRQALGELNEGFEIADWPYKLETADLLYCRVFRDYVMAPDPAETPVQRVNRLVADAVRAQNLDVRQSMVLRAEFGEALQQHEFWYDRYKSRFLWLDAFPSNASRFPLAYKDCAPAAV